jgi:heme exporter protein A
MGLRSSLQLREVACGAGHRTLFEGLNIELKSGQWAALRGHNGSGKSTLLRCVAGLSKVLSGDIASSGRILYQSHHSGWKDSFTALENLRWQAQLEGVMPTTASVEAIELSLERVGIRDQARLSFSKLSAGQKRRLSLARLLVSPSTVWLLDEPSTALDQQGQKLFSEILAKHLARGGLGLIATHLDIPDLAAQFTINLGET